MLRIALVLGLVFTLSLHGLGQTTSAPAGRPPNPVLGQSVPFPAAGLKLERTEFDGAGKEIAGTRTQDSLTYVDGRIQTPGFAAMGFPAVTISVNPGNATDFFQGTAKTTDGGTITWQWKFLQLDRELFRASVTLEKEGKTRNWQLNEVVPPTTQVK